MKRMKKLLTVLALSLGLIAPPAFADHDAHPLWEPYDNLVSIYVQKWSQTVCVAANIVCVLSGNVGEGYAPASRTLRSVTGGGTGWTAAAWHPAYPWHMWAHAGKVRTGVLSTTSHDVYFFNDWTTDRNPSVTSAWAFELYNDGTIEVNGPYTIDPYDTAGQEKEITLNFTATRNTAVILAFCQRRLKTDPLSTAEN